VGNSLVRIQLDDPRCSTELGQPLCRPEEKGRRTITVRHAPFPRSPLSTYFSRPRTPGALVHSETEYFCQEFFRNVRDCLAARAWLFTTLGTRFSPGVILGPSAPPVEPIGSDHARAFSLQRNRFLYKRSLIPCFPLARQKTSGPPVWCPEFLTISSISIDLFRLRQNERSRSGCLSLCPLTLHRRIFRICLRSLAGPSDSDLLAAAFYSSGR